MTRQSDAAEASARLGWFIPAYALANIGAFAAFAPVLSLVLPIRAEEIAGGDGKVALLSSVLLVGAVVASLANLIAGAIADRVFAKSGTRIPLIALGLAGTIGSYAVLAAARTPATLFGAICLFELMFNLLFAPLNTLLADHVPDALKGRMAGLLNLGLPGGYLTTALLTLPLFAIGDARLVVLGFVVAAAIVPLLLVGRHAVPRVQPAADAARIGVRSQAGGGRIAWIWVSRLAVQMTGAVITSYLLYVIQGLGGVGNEGGTGWTAERLMGPLIAVGVIVSVLVGLTTGAISDRTGARTPFMRVAAIGLTLVMLSWWGIQGWPVIAIGYVVVCACLAMFLTAESALVAELVQGDPECARIMAVMNLTNTLPGIIVPGIALALAHGGVGLSELMLFCAATAAIAFWCVGRLARQPLR